MQANFHRGKRNSAVYSFLSAIFIVNLIFSSNLVDLNYNSIGSNTIYNRENQMDRLIEPLSSNFFQDELFSGVSKTLEINESADLKDYQSFQIGNGTETGYDSTNLEFFIDDTHNWEAFQLTSKISDINDERDWIKDGDMDVASSWTSYEVDSNNAVLNKGFGSIGGQSGFYSYMQPYDVPISTDYRYYSGDEAGYKQTITVPRGNIVDAWLSFDFYLDYGVYTNDLVALVEIDSETIYSKGFRTINDLGVDTWHSTGFINKIFWENSSNVFSSPIIDNSFEIKVGIRAETNNDIEDSSNNLLYFDNVKLILKTEANATQNLIELSFGGESVSDVTINGWGEAEYEKTGLWNSDPMQILMETEASKLYYNVNSTVSMKHHSNTTIAHYGDDGIISTIKSDGTINWEFYHNVFYPNEYDNYEFIMEKPEDWNITAVYDPTGLVTPFEFGQQTQDKLKVNQTFAKFPGWWRFKAQSPNYLNLSETKIKYNNQWENNSQLMDENFVYHIGDTINIKTKIEQTMGAIPNINETIANITIYYPNGTIVYQNSANPDISGNVQFSAINIESDNAVGGIYSYKITWLNGTKAGGTYGYFEIKRELDIEVMIPVLTNNIAESMTHGDIISFKLKLKDKYNDLLIEDAHILFGWGNSSTKSLIMSEKGIYEGYFDTSDFEDTGDHNFEFNATIDGYELFSITIQVETIPPFIPEDVEQWLIDYWWVLGIAFISIIALSTIIYRLKVSIPKKARTMEALNMKVQIFDDLDNIRGVMLIHKESGLLLYHHAVNAFETDDTLITGFLQAIIMFSKGIAGNQEASEALEFTHENFHIMITDGPQIRVAMILEHAASDNLRKKVKILSEAAHEEFKVELKKWTGNLTAYEARAPALVITTLKLYMIGKLVHNDKKFGNLWTNAKPHKNPKAEDLLFTIKNLSWGQDFFYIKPILESQRPDKLIETKEIFIDLFNEKRLIPYDPNTVHKRAEELTKNKLFDSKNGKVKIEIDEEDWFNDED